MKINFILPNTKISGGVKVVLEYANHLQQRGHKVSVIYPNYWGRPIWARRERRWRFCPTPTDLLGVVKKLAKFNNSTMWFDIKANLIKVPTLAEKYIPNADIVMATWWETAYWVSKYSSEKGKKFYLIQHHEVWGDPKETVEETYKMGLVNIVISSWLKNLLEKSGANVEYLIFNGINFKEFYPENAERISNKLRILIPYRKEEWKGVEDGIKAFQIAKREHPDLQLVVFGPKPEKGELPDNTEFHFLPVKDKLREIYNSCDIFVFPSRCEGFGLPPMEAMACRRPVVTTNVGAVPDYTIPEKTALVSPPASPEALAQNIIRLIENERLREEIAEAGYRHILKNFSWEKAVGELERVFKKYAGR